MDKDTREALKTLMLAIGQIQDGEVYLAAPYDQQPEMFDAYGKVAALLGEDELTKA